MGRVVLTGAAGFIGCHLAHRFLDEGVEVLGVDNFLTGSVENVSSLAVREGFTFLEHDVSVPFAVEGEVAGVLHFASPASPIDFLAHPIETLLVGSAGTHHLLKLARSKGARFLLASTSEVYGDPEVHPQTEGYWGHVNPVGPRSAYDEAKRFAEAMTMAYHREFGVKVSIARIFNTYGPRMRPDDGRVVSNFIVQALRGEALTIYGEGQQTRSFCYVDDLIDGILRLFRSGLTGPVNLGNPEEFTIRGLADVVLSQIRTGSTIDHSPLPEDDPRLRRPDISLAREKLGWEPSVQLEEGLRRTIRYFRDQVVSEDLRARPLR